jgi:hypothetical protein
LPADAQTSGRLASLSRFSCMKKSAPLPLKDLRGLAVSTFSTAE